LLKDHWEESAARYRDFWAGEPIDRPPVLFDSIGPWGHPMYRGAGYDYQKYGEDIERFCRDYERVWEARVACRDDTIPCIAPQMGGVIEAAMWAGEIEWGAEVSSLVPPAPLAGVKDLREVTFDPDNKHYRRVLREGKALSEMSRGRFGVNFEASCSITTTISQLRGGTRFLYDVIDDPEGVRIFGRRICDQLIRLQREVDRLAPHPGGGTCHRWLNYWNPGRGFWFSEDDAVLLSPELYRDVFLDLDRKLCASTDCPAVHWHDAGLHLIDAVLEIGNLRMVQLSPDPNGPPFERLLASCRRIERSGRKVCLQMEWDADRVEAIFRAIPPDSCMFYFGFAESIDAANAVCARLEQLARPHRRAKR